MTKVQEEMKNLQGLLETLKNTPPASNTGFKPKLERPTTSMNGVGSANKAVTPKTGPKKSSSPVVALSDKSTENESSATAATKRG